MLELPSSEPRTRSTTANMLVAVESQNLTMNDLSVINDDARSEVDNS